MESEEKVAQRLERASPPPRQQKNMGSHIVKDHWHWPWWCRPVIPATERLEGEDGKFKAFLDYKVSSRLT